MATQSNSVTIGFMGETLGESARTSEKKLKEALLKLSEEEEVSTGAMLQFQAELQIWGVNAGMYSSSMKNFGETINNLLRNIG